MIEIRINKDIGSYEAKFIGPFTLRQTICILLAAPVCWGIYRTATPILGGDLAGFLVLIPAALCRMFGWSKPYGMHMEKFLHSIWVTTVLAPSKRPYKTENRHSRMLDAMQAAVPVASGKMRKYKISSEAIT